jgi:hypothetical protein
MRSYLKTLVVGGLLSLPFLGFGAGFIVMGVDSTVQGWASLGKPKLHNWYNFWNKSLGKPVAKGTADSDGTVRREFENGTAVYNPMGNVASDARPPLGRRLLRT